MLFGFLKTIWFKDEFPTVSLDSL